MCLTRKLRQGRLMAHDRIRSQSAAWLSSSMRDLGCSLDTAIADLFDNSISAGADALCNLSGKPPWQSSSGMAEA